MKFKPLEVLVTKRTQEKATLTGPWFNEVRHQGKFQFL